ncbi:MAG: hypothetical protein RL215_2591 [Planctomycetota bacterium]
MPPQPLIQWRFLDGRAGHESQVLGLSEAIAAVCTSVLVDVPVDDSLRSWRAFLPGRFDFLRTLAAPQLLIGAGHATHAALLRCQQLFGGRTVVLMKPSLPAGLFDLCLVPSHDRLLWPWSNVERTAGALNRMQRSEHRGSERGLVLLGGPSRHFAWSNEQVRRGIRELIASQPLRWTVAASRRTPAELLGGWQDRPVGVEYRSADELSGAELAELIGLAARVGVTSDSISMISEVLTSGALVELIELPARGSGRVAAEVRMLVRSSGRLQGGLSERPESERCAGLVLERFFGGVPRLAGLGGAAMGGRWSAGVTVGGAMRPGGILLSTAVARDGDQ